MATAFNPNMDELETDQEVVDHQADEDNDKQNSTQVRESISREETWELLKDCEKVKMKFYALIII